MSGRVYRLLDLVLVLACGLAWRAGAQPGEAPSAVESAERVVRVEIHDGALVGSLRDRVWRASTAVPRAVRSSRS
jgi:hypothetical protein